MSVFPCLLTFTHSWPNVSWNNFTNYYPGNSYVDWVGVDGYNWGNTLSGHSWIAFQQLFSSSGGVYQTYASMKPIMIAETASVETGAPVGQSKATWITDMANSIISSFPDIQAILWFDSTGLSGNTQWPIDSSLSAQSAYTAAGQMPYFNPPIHW